MARALSLIVFAVLQGPAADIAEAAGARVPAPRDAVLIEGDGQPVDGAVHTAVRAARRPGGEQGALRGAHPATSEAGHEAPGARASAAHLHAAHGAAPAEDARRGRQVRRAAHDLPGARRRGVAPNPGAVPERDTELRVAHRLPGHEERADAADQETLPIARQPALGARQLSAVHRQTIGSRGQVARARRHPARAAHDPVERPGRDHGLARRLQDDARAPATRHPQGGDCHANRALPVSAARRAGPVDRAVSLAQRPHQRDDGQSGGGAEGQIGERGRAPRAAAQRSREPRAGHGHGRQQNAADSRLESRRDAADRCALCPARDQVEPGPEADADAGTDTDAPSQRSAR